MSGFVAVREGFTEIRCPACGGSVHAPLGPDHWHPAVHEGEDAFAEPKRGLRCGCGVTILRVTLGMFVNWPAVLQESGPPGTGGEWQFGELREQVRRDTLRAYDLKAYQFGLAPVPWRIRVWRRVSFARWWRMRRSGSGGCGDPVVGQVE